MTVKQVAEALGVSRKLIENRINELFPGKMQARKTTYLDEAEVTAIKLRIQENSHLIPANDRSQMAKTELEKFLLIKQGYELLMSQVDDLTKENAIMKPKAAFYDRVTDSRDAIQIGDAAKVLNMGVGRNQLFEFLRGIKVLMADNMPYQKYINRGYFRVIEQEYEKPSGETGVSTKTLVYQKGLDFIRKKLQEVKKC